MADETKPKPKPQPQPAPAPEPEPDGDPHEKIPERNESGAPRHNDPPGVGARRPI